MPRWTHTTVSLTAGQAAGTDPILAAETGAAGTGSRRLIAIGNRSASAVEFFFATGGVAGNGMPLAAGGRMDLGAVNVGFDGALYVLGAAAGDEIILWTA